MTAAKKLKDDAFMNISRLKYEECGIGQPEGADLSADVMKINLNRRDLRRNRLHFCIDRLVSTPA
jgi:hypothetical protein